MAEARTLRAGISQREFQRQATLQFDAPIARVRSAAGPESANVVRFTLQVVDRLGKPWGPVEGRWLIEVYLSPTQHGAPSAAGNTVAWITGTVYDTVLANAAYRVLADANGKAELDVTVAGAATRFVHTAACGLFEPGGAGTWT